MKNLLFLMILLLYSTYSFSKLECPQGLSIIKCWANSQCQPPVGIYGGKCVEGICADVKNNALCTIQ